MISNNEALLKRFFDLLLGLMLLPFFLFPIVFLIILQSFDTGQYGLFSQTRIGQFGKPFKIFKIRTLKQENHQLGRLEASATTIGKFLRYSKLDEIPQIFNVIKGEMSFVGPRPDVPGFADKLQGDDRLILKVKPGITGPATIKYKNEEELLSKQVDPEAFNRNVIWRDKVEINKNYVQTWSFSLDLKIILKSLFN